MTDLERPDDPQDTAKLKAVLVLVAAIAFALSPFVAPPFSGFDPAQMPVAVENPPIQPAGYAFSIWGVIYLWLLAHAGFGLVRRDTARDWDTGRWGLFLSLAVGASWLSVATMAPVTATVLILVMLVGALWVLLRAPSRDRWWNALPLGLYAGWLTAASCVALGSVLIGYGVGSPAAVSWAMLALALILSVTLAMRLRTPAYPLAVAWALVGIVVTNGATALGIAAGLGAAALLALAVRDIRA